MRFGEAVALVDERGSLTYTELQTRSNALAHELRRRGMDSGSTVGILARGHRWFLDVSYACGKLGARIVYLNTDFAAPQLRDVVAREGIDAIVADEEFWGLVEELGGGHERLLAWVDDLEAEHPAPLIEDLIRRGSPLDPPPPPSPSKVVLLTSGTTGTPKGAPRDQPRSMTNAGGLLWKVPFRVRESTFVAAPSFHSWGFIHTMLAISLGSTVVVQRKFDPRQTLALLEEHGCTALVLVPVMLQRLLDLGEDEIRARDLSRLRIIFCGGSQLHGGLVTRAMDVFGDVVYNLYGSTEVSCATIATPADLRAAPRLRRPAAPRNARADPRRQRTAAALRSDRAHLRRRRPAVRRLHGRRRQGDDRRPACRPATSATSTPPAACSSTAATTT